MTDDHTNDRLDGQLAQQLVERARAEGVDLVGPNGLLAGVTKRVLETGLQVEMSEHLGYDKHAMEVRNGGNSRNGTRSKTVLTEVGPVELDVPRDRDGTFDPQTVKKRQRRLTGVDEMVISLCAKGLTTGEISAHLAEVYGARVSKETISKITDAVMGEMTEWLNRPLERVYAAVFIDAIVVKIRDGQVTNRVRADTTVVEANVAYPTDSGLLAKGVAKMAAAISKVKAAGLATRTATRDRTRSVRARDIAANLRRRSEAARDEVRAINADLARIAERAAAEARAVVRNARRALRDGARSVSGRVRAAIAVLETTAKRVERIAAQTRQRIAGTTPDGATRLVSLHDPDARPIAKGRLGKPVEFGYKAQVVDNEDGVVVDHNVEMGNPPDAPMLDPAVERVTRRAGRPPAAVAADRSYGEKKVEDALVERGVRTVAVPRKGRPSAARRQVERRQSFRRLVKWRTGSEGRISCLKRDFGWTRTRNDGLEGARTWCGHAVFNHNLAKIAALMD